MGRVHSKCLETVVLLLLPMKRLEVPSCDPGLLMLHRPAQQLSHCLAWKAGIKLPAPHVFRALEANRFQPSSRVPAARKLGGKYLQPWDHNTGM